MLGLVISEKLNRIAWACSSSKFDMRKRTVPSGRCRIATSYNGAVGGTVSRNWRTLSGGVASILVSVQCGALPIQLALFSPTHAGR